jgi:hypothetical protein
MDEQLAARPRAAGLDEAEVLGREVRVQRELELAQPSVRPPEAMSSPTVCGSCSVSTTTLATVAGDCSAALPLG